MPNYYSWEDFELKVDVCDQNKWKTRFHQWKHYYIGDIVKLVISIERLTLDAPSFTDIRITEKMPASAGYIARKPGPGSATSFTKVVFAIRGDVLDESGDDVWRLEVHKTGLTKKSRKIFDAGISNRDTRRRDYLIIILTVVAILLAIITLVVTYLMFLQGLPK